MLEEGVVMEAALMVFRALVTAQGAEAEVAVEVLPQVLEVQGL